MKVFVKDNLWRESKIHFGDPCQLPSPHFPSSFTLRLPQFFSDFPVLALHNNCPGCQSTDGASHRAQPHFLSKSRIEKTLIIYYYKETITTGSVHIIHNNDDNEENFLLGNASGKGVYKCCLVDVVKMYCCPKNLTYRGGRRGVVSTTNCFEAWLL